MPQRLTFRSLPSLLLAATIVLASILIAPARPAQAISTPWLSVSGRFIRDPNGNNVILRGVSLVDVSVANAGTRTAQQLIDMATNEADGWYARVVRLPVYPDAIDGQPGWRANPDAYFNNHLDPAVQHCISKQIYCIIDWHYIRDYNSAEVDTATRAFWSYVAPRYSNVPNVIFELYNEPVNPDNWSTWKSVAQPWVNLIRAAAPNNLILIGGPRWSQNVASAATDPFVGSNLVYVAHVYPEHGGQSTWDSWFGNSAATVPYFITEWGWQQGGFTPTNGTFSSYGAAFSNYLDSKAVSWTAWVFDNIWQPVMFDANWNLLGGENFMGQFTKDFLFQHRNDNLPGASTSTPTPTPTSTLTRTNTPTGPTNTPTRTNTPSTPGALKVQLVAGGTDNTQQSSFRFRVQNTGSSALSNISTRVYFTLDGSQAPSSYVLEKYYDQSGVAVVSGPTQASGSTYYFTVNYGTASLAASGSWEFHTNIHLSNWSNNHSSANDWWRSTGTLPASYSDWANIPGYVSGTRVWGSEPGTSGTNTPTPTNTPVAPTNTSTSTRTNTPVGPTNTPTRTPTNTPVTPTPTRTNTPVGPTSTATATRTNTPSTPGALKVQLTGGTDNTQQSAFNFRIQNTGSSALSNLSARLYFTLDGSQAASNYVLEKYWDQSGVAVISGPTLASGSTYYFTINYGTASLSAGSSWEFQTSLHLSSWSNNYSSANDWWRSTGTLPVSFSDWANIPAYVNGTRVWGSEPGAGGTNTPTNTPSGPTSTPTPTRTNTPIGPTATPTRTNTPGGPTSTPTPTPTNPPNGTHLDNPFVGATFYRNIDYMASVNAAADLIGGTLGAQMRQVTNFPTFVWLDSIDAVNGTNGYPRGLEGHLDAAVVQGANAIGIVVYDLPNRDCSALASNGELLIAQNGFNRYKAEYIDVIYNVITSKPAYANLRIVAVIEPDSLPNLVTNTGIPKCQEAMGPGGYREATQYTLNKLAPLSNFYAYIDIGHHGWLGWDSNFGPAVTLIADTIKGTTLGVNSISGFISNTANTTVTNETFMTANQSISGNPVRSANYHQWNTYIDETTFDIAWRNAMIAQGFPSTIGMLIDTSRNGWGGPNRPTAASTSTDLNTFVNEGRIDRRIHKGNWCNQSGAGIGARPVAAPAAGFDAYVWVKPPGESDGSSTLVPTGPDNPGGKGFDRMCDPTYGGNSLNGNNPTGALANAPVSGRWFQAQFEELVRNAYPPFP